VSVPEKAAGGVKVDDVVTIQEAGPITRRTLPSEMLMTVRTMAGSNGPSIDGSHMTFRQPVASRILTMA